MPLPENQSPNPEGQGGGAAPEEQNQQQQAQEQQQNVFNDIVTKKGFKSPDEFANSYSELEKAHGRYKNTFNTVKQQLESAGYTVDENGKIVQTGGGQQTPAQQQQGYYGQDQQQEVIYDPYSGQPINNPLDAQLARLPMSQRIGYVANAIFNQNEQFRNDAFNAEQEILNMPEAKGFEDDVRKVMIKVPLHLRAKKEEWNNALLRVKGARYDTDKKQWGQQQVDDFINTQNSQGLPARGGSSGSGVRLTPEQEKNYQYYQKTYPGKFRDRAHFSQYLSPTGGR